LEEIKFGAPNLLADGKQFFEAKDYSKAKDKFQTLLEKYPDFHGSSK
jgi:TolA-binding protein